MTSQSFFFKKNEIGINDIVVRFRPKQLSGAIAVHVAPLARLRGGMAQATWCIMLTCQICEKEAYLGDLVCTACYGRPNQRYVLVLLSWPEPLSDLLQQLASLPQRRIQLNQLASRCSSSRRGSLS